MSQKPPDQKGRSPILLFAGAALGIALIMNFNKAAQPPEPQLGSMGVSYTAFLERANNHNLTDIYVSDDGFLLGKNDKDPAQNIVSRLPKGSSIMEDTEGSGINVTSVAPPPPPEPGFFARHPLLMMLLPTMLLIGFFFWMAKKQAGGGGMSGFAKSKAKLISNTENKVTFDDVAGVDEAKEDLEEIVEFLKNPGKFQRLGGKMPTGVLMVGPPGTGKTLIARAVAGEAKVPFFSISGSDFVEMYVGVGASRVRDMFEQAKKNAPCIIFIDEIDAVGKKRGAGGAGGGHDEREQTLNQLLVEMDGFATSPGVIVIAATNQPEALDPALLRPGRFDRQVTLNLPDINGREKILKVHAKKVPLAPDVNLLTVARGTPGFSGADLANLINESALHAARLDKKSITMDDIEWAKDKVYMGAERRSLMMSEKEKRMTAYHEAGHVIVTITEPQCDPLHKVTIIPRGRALGVTWSLPTGDSVSLSAAKIRAQIANLYGGREAEEKAFGWDNVTTGASNDIQRATDYAEHMVKEWGLSDKIGPRRFSSNHQESFLGAVGGGGRAISDELQRDIDSEINRILKEGQNRARDIIETRHTEFVAIAEALYKYETLSSEDVDAIVRGESIDDRKEQERLAAEKNKFVAKVKPANANDNLFGEQTSGKEFKPFKVKKNPDDRSPR